MNVIFCDIVFYLWDLFFDRVFEIVGDVFELGLWRFMRSSDDGIEDRGFIVNVL